MVGNALHSKTKRARAGFTIVELLAAIAILAVLGTMVTAAMVTGSRISVTTTQSANASVLAQSIDTALSDVLRYANVDAPAGSDTVDNPTFSTDSYSDVAGDPVRGGRIVVDEGHLALSTASGAQPVPKAVGIYTDFTVTDFSLSYDCGQNLFRGTYTLSADGGFSRTCEFACRTLVDEAQ